MLTLVLVCCCHLQIRAAELIPPTEPEWTPTSVAVESGKVYYMYNVELGMYLAQTGGNLNYCVYSSSIDNAVAMEAVNTSNGWTLKNVSVNSYVSFYNDTYGYANYGSLSAHSYWNIIGTVDNYKIQLLPSHSKYASQKYFGGVNTNDNRAYSLASKNIVWKFVDAEVMERYVVLKQFYDALNLAYGYNFYVSSYRDIYDHQSDYKISELYSTVTKLKSEINTSSPLVASNNEYPIIIGTKSGNWTYSDQNKRASATLGANGVASMYAKFNVDKPSTIYYTSSTSGTNVQLFVTVDGVSTHTFNNGYEAYNVARHFEVLEPGEHTIEWRYVNITNTSPYYGSLSEIGVMSYSNIKVSLLEPGSLGTEVLYNVDRLKDVKSLSIKGKMNNDDWSKIAMMDNIMELDLSEAIITTIPEKGLSLYADDSFGYLHKVTLPEGLLSISDKAFQGTYLEEINIPSTVENIGSYAFYKTNLRSIVIPNATSIGTYVFEQCHYLHDVSLSPSLTTIPSYAFSSCRALTNCVLPEGIRTIGNYAFENCFNLIQTFPESLTSIGSYAYYDCDRLCNGTERILTIPAKVSSIGASAFEKSGAFNKLIIKGAGNIGNGAFYNCSNLQEIDLPVKFYAINKTTTSIFAGCPNVNKIILRSPTLVTHESTLGCTLSNVDLVVPEYLIPSYKLDSYWYDYKTISGFSTSEIQDWLIENPLTLNHDRFEGNPSIQIGAGNVRKPSLKINGDKPMSINNLLYCGSITSNVNYPGQLLSNCDNISITGELQTNLYTNQNYWYFFSLPFDIKVSEITHNVSGVQKAVRYYDGANRATKGGSGSWKNYEEDAIIPAGTGFIMQTNLSTRNDFHALDNANKQQSVKNVEFVKTLEVNDSQSKSNKGWNLVGNPWQCYYNSHMLNFTGPIIVWNVSNKTYTAYSIIDDDYAIRPNEAFFVQCPNAEYNTIGFPTQGRQLTDVIENQNAAKPLALQGGKQRKLVNVVISNGADEDQTRVVLNENASMEYELSCDASKMMSMDASVPQIYSLDEEGTEYAINERPMKDGVVALGAFFPKEGEYTIRLERNDAETVMLLDNETDETYSLTAGEYSFYASAGTNDSRFSLVFNPAETTGVGNVNIDRNADKVYYNLYGQRVQKDANGIVVVKGKKYFNKK